jgi:hypothetical protein
MPEVPDEEEKIPAKRTYTVVDTSTRKKLKEQKNE